METVKEEPAAAGLDRGSTPQKGHRRGTSSKPSILRPAFVTAGAPSIVELRSGGAWDQKQARLRSGKSEKNSRSHRGCGHREGWTRNRGMSWTRGQVRL